MGYVDLSIDFEVFFLGVNVFTKNNTFPKNKKKYLMQDFVFVFFLFLILIVRGEGVGI